MTDQQIEIIIKVATTVATILAILFAVYQYKKGQIWQKGNIILSLIDSFENNDRIRLAREMLDWDEREVVLDDKRKIQFTNLMLIKALEVVEMDDKRFSKEESLIRDCFDSFFDFFHKLDSFQQNGLITFKELNYFFYYFELIRDIGVYKKDPLLKQTVEKYIDAYHFIGISKLLEEYSKYPKPLNIMWNEK